MPLAVSPRPDKVEHFASIGPDSDTLDMCSAPYPFDLPAQRLDTDQPLQRSPRPTGAP